MQVCKVRYKNDSNELTYVMNSGLHGSLNDKGEVIMPKPKPVTQDERLLHDLLQMVSDKIRERFKDLNACFRFLDSNHS